MLVLNALLLINATSDGAPWPVYLISVVVCVVIATASSWQFFIQWLNGFRGRNWPAVAAVIDLASVQKRVQSTGKGDIVTYVALFSTSTAIRICKRAIMTGRSTMKTKLRRGRTPSKEPRSRSTCTRTIPRVLFCVRKTLNGPRRRLSAAFRHKNWVPIFNATEPVS